MRIVTMLTKYLKDNFISYQDKSQLALNEKTAVKNLLNQSTTKKE